MKCLHKDPAERFADADELREALDACRLETPWTQRRAAQWWADSAAEPTAQTTASAADLEATAKMGVVG